MAHKIGLTIEVFYPQERDDLICKLADLLDDHGATNRTFTITYEEQTPRGKKTIKETLEFTAGEMVDVNDFGMLVERPLERALRELDGTTISAGGKSVTIRRKPLAVITPDTVIEEDEGNE